MKVAKPSVPSFRRIKITKETSSTVALAMLVHFVMVGHTCIMQVVVRADTVVFGRVYINCGL